MNALHRRTLFWTPRILAMLYIAFLSMFALDVFAEEHGFWRIQAALSIHLIPVFILVVVLILAWQWEWVGAVLYAAAGVLYVAWVLQRPIAPAMKFKWTLAIAGPTFLIAALFLVNWFKHGELHHGHLADVVR